MKEASTIILKAPLEIKDHHENTTTTLVITAAGKIH